MLLLFQQKGKYLCEKWKKEQNIRTISGKSEVTHMFRYDSPFMRLMTLFANLVILNLLWLLCCLPVITAGAATASAYYVVFRWLTKEDDAVIKPFFKAFRQNFRPVTPIFVLNALVGAAMAAEIVYLSADSSALLRIIFAVIFFIFAAFTSWLYPIAGRYDSPMRQVMLNSITLTLRHPLTSLAVSLLNLLPVILFLFFEPLFWQSSILWIFIGFAAVALLNGYQLLRVFCRYDSPEQEELHEH